MKQHMLSIALTAANEDNRVDIMEFKATICAMASEIQLPGPPHLNQVNKPQPITILAF